ncbi:hypothetical protein [Dactylosporangium sp. NPDC000521]|uniref:hypothetical protein n=1 Tax=Dactylosporangium sp. NPDC000521 TaxID=3363975 RepID=UPI0036A0EB38
MKLVDRLDATRTFLKAGQRESGHLGAYPPNFTSCCCGAPGVLVIGATQDPRKEVVELRSSEP